MSVKTQKPKAESNTVTERETSRNVTLFIGLPGAGKTEACRIAEEAVEGEADSFEVSTFVRNEFQKEVGDGVGDNELGRWAAEKKEEHGNDYFVRNMAERLADLTSVPENINIAGVRSPAEADAVREVFDDVTIVTIWTLPDVRYRRLNEREGEYSREEFEERKERELWDWGCIEFFWDENYYDHIVSNNWELEYFENDIRGVMKSDDIYTKPPWPVLPSKEHLAQYL